MWKRFPGHLFLKLQRRIDQERQVRIRFQNDARLFAKQIRILFSGCDQEFHQINGRIGAGTFRNGRTWKVHEHLRYPVDFHILMLPDGFQVMAQRILLTHRIFQRWFVANRCDASQQKLPFAFFRPEKDVSACDEFSWIVKKNLKVKLVTLHNR